MLAEDGIAFRPSVIWLMSLNATLSCAFMGYCGTVIAMPQHNIAYDLGLGDNSDSFYSIFVSIHYIGCAFGALYAGKLSDSIGRRGGLIVADFIGITGCLLFLFPTMITLIIGRIVTGFSSGICATIPALYVKEISPPQISGKTGCTYQIMCMGGVLFGYVIGLPLPIDDYSTPSNKWWMFMMILPAAILLFQLFVFLAFFRSETPAFSIVKQNRQDLTQIIGELYQSESIFKHKTKLLSKYEVTEEKGKSAATDAYEMTYRDYLFDPRFRKMMIIGMTTQICQQWSGNNAILNYATKIFMAFSTTSTARLMTVLIGLFNLIATACAIFLVDNLGRKKMLSQGVLILSGILFLIGFVAYYKMSLFYATLLICIFMLTYGITLGAVTWLYCGEVLTDSGISISCFFAYVNLFALVYSFDFISSFGLYYAFWMYSSISFGFYIFYSYYLIETRGLTKEEICEALIIAPKKLSF